MSALTRALTTRSETSKDVGLLLGRVVLGAVFIAHGWQKWSDGISSTQQGFASMGVPAADVSAVLLALLEVGGGALLILGALTPLVGGLLGLSMIGAGWFAHRDAFLVTDGGFEYVLVLAALAFALALAGPGRLSLDAILGARARSGR